ncbi:MAG: hypothetical protein GWP08_03130, partial [Nitrospiraceae bacterium]|nr:hypothetical protein [Nitrospiraceae bacterium]
MSDGYHMEDEVQQRAYDAHLMKRLIVYVRPHRKALALAVVLLLLMAILSTLTPWLNWKAIAWYINDPERVALDEQIVQFGSDAGPDLMAEAAAKAADDRGGLVRLIGIIALLLLGEALCRYFQTLIVSIVGQKTMLRMRMEIFTHLQRMSLRFLDRNPVGRLMTRVTNDVEKIQDTIVGGVVQIINDLFVIVVVLVFMAWNNWQLTLIALSPIPFVFLTGVVFRKYVQKSYLEIRKKIASLNAYAQENISGMRVVQIFCREAENFEQYRQRNAGHRDE